MLNNVGEILNEFSREVSAQSENLQFVQGNLCANIYSFSEPRYEQSENAQEVNIILCTNHCDFSES